MGVTGRSDGVNVLTPSPFPPLTEASHADVLGCLRRYSDVQYACVHLPRECTLILVFFCSELQQWVHDHTNEALSSCALKIHGISWLEFPRCTSARNIQFSLLKVITCAKESKS